MTVTNETRGKSLTPLHRSEEVSQRSFRDGIIAGSLAMIPSAGIVYYLHQNSEKFRKVSDYVILMLMQHHILIQPKPQTKPDELEVHISKYYLIFLPFPV